MSKKELSKIIVAVLKKYPSIYIPGKDLLEQIAGSITAKIPEDTIIAEGEVAYNDVHADFQIGGNDTGFTIYEALMEQKLEGKKVKLILEVLND